MAVQITDEQREVEGHKKVSEDSATLKLAKTAGLLRDVTKGS